MTSISSPGIFRGRSNLCAILLFLAGKSSKSLYSSYSSYMSTFSRKERDGNFIKINAVEGTHSCSIIFLHGLGDNADGIYDIGKVISDHLPHAKLLLPTAPSRGVTINNGAVGTAWYDVKGITDTFSEGIDDSARMVEGLLDAEHSAGIPYSRMVLAGFSQGGALSLFTGLQLPAEKKLGGIVVMSGYLAGSGRFTITKGLENTKIYHGHGDSDPLVSSYVILY